MTTVILRTTARVVLPIIILYSFVIFLQGHNLPGGGFIAGVLTALGISLVYIAFSIDYLERYVLGEGVESTYEHFKHSIVVRYRLIFALGLGIALTTGVGSMVFGFPFMTQDYWVLHDLPIYGEVEVASAVAFDFGVYVVVVGALLTIVSMIGGE